MAPYIHNGIDRSAAMSRTWAFPLDEVSYFNSLEEAEAAAATAAFAGSTNTKYYFGQVIVVCDEESKFVQPYIIDIQENEVETEVEDENGNVTTTTSIVYTGCLRKIYASQKTEITTIDDQYTMKMLKEKINEIITLLNK